MKPARRELEIENARLRGQIEALEKIVEAYRTSQAAPTPVWPWMQPAAPTLPLPPSPFNPLGGHGGMCACPQCVPPVWGTISVFPTDLVVGGPQRPGGTYGASP